MIRRSGIMIVYPELSANKRIIHIEKSNYTCQYNNTLNVIKHTIRDNSKSIIDELSTRLCLNMIYPKANYITSFDLHSLILSTLYNLVTFINSLPIMQQIINIQSLN